MKKIWMSVALAMVALVALVGCKNAGGGAETAGGFEAGREINVISREDGSGTRGAFVELFEVEEKDSSGRKVDNTTQDATITNSTSVMMTTVAGDEYAIGYISLGSLNGSVKAAKIDGAAASVANIKNGSYQVARPFNVAMKKTDNAAANDFLKYILSQQGQSVVEEEGYISVDAQGGYVAAGASGKVVVAGSSSVTPVMEKLKEAYIALNPKVEIEIQQSDSSTGMKSAIDGVCDIGMASRELKDSEKAEGLKPIEIAKDGIAIIVNNKNTIESLTSEQVKAIYLGETTVWNDIIQ